MIIDLDRLVAWIRRWTWADVAVRAAMVATALGALAATAGAASGSMSGQVVGLVAATALLAAARPDSSAPAATMVVVVGVWLRLVDDRVTGWTFVAAVLLAVFHAAASVAALAPLGAALDRRAAARWGRRLGVVAMVSAVACGVAALLARHGPDGNAALLGAALVAAAGGALALVWLSARPVSRPGSRPRR